MENEKDTIKRMKLDMAYIAETIRNATNLNEAKAVLSTAAVLRNLPDCSEEIKNYIHNNVGGIYYTTNENDSVL